jgi:four helix bundle protein
VQDFRHVKAWESAVLVAVKARKIVAKFPRQGYSELREQLIGAAESISHNIAEGRSAGSAKEFLRFLDVAVRSATETISQLNLALEYGIASQRDVFDLIGTIICTRRMIKSLQNTIRDDLERAAGRSRRRRK